MDRQLAALVVERVEVGMERALALVEVSGQERALGEAVGTLGRLSPHREMSRFALHAHTCLRSIRKPHDSHLDVHALPLPSDIRRDAFGGHVGNLFVRNSGDQNANIEAEEVSPMNCSCNVLCNVPR